MRDELLRLITASSFTLGRPVNIATRFAAIWSQEARSSSTAPEDKAEERHQSPINDANPCGTFPQSNMISRRRAFAEQWKEQLGSSA